MLAPAQLLIGHHLTVPPAPQRGKDGNDVRHRRGNDGVGPGNQLVEKHKGSSGSNGGQRTNGYEGAHAVGMTGNQPRGAIE